MNAHSPIGIFDSGVGGLSVLRPIRERLPAESLIYLADSAHAPYGGRPVEQIRARCRQIAGHFQSLGVKALVVACNTATAAAVEDLRAEFAFPIVAMEPALKPAVQHSRTGVVGILATEATLASPRYARLLERYGEGARVMEQACPGLVEHVESGDLKSPGLRDLLAGYLAPLLAAGADRLVLGCTHYPFLMPLLEELLAGRMSLLETGPAVAAELQRQLSVRGLRRPDGEGGCRFLTSADPACVGPVLERLWGEPVSLERCVEAG